MLKLEHMRMYHCIQKLLTFCYLMQVAELPSTIRLQKPRKEVKNKQWGPCSGGSNRICAFSIFMMQRSYHVGNICVALSRHVRVVKARVGRCAHACGQE